MVTPLRVEWVIFNWVIKCINVPTLRIVKKKKLSGLFKT